MPESTDVTTFVIIQFDILDQLHSDLGRETYTQLLGLFVIELTQLQHRLSVAINDQDHADILDTTHILKNTAALYGAQRLAFLANEVYSTQLGDEYLRQTIELMSVINLTLTNFTNYISTLAK